MRASGAQGIESLCSISESDLSSCWPIRLGAAYLATALLAAAGVVVAIIMWPELRRHELAELNRSGQFAAGCAIGYLIIAAICQFRIGRSLRRGDLAAAPQTLLVPPGHGLVLAASAVALWRGPYSLGLLAGLEGPLTVIAIVALACTAITLSAAWRIRQTIATNCDAADRRGIIRSRPLDVAQIVVCVLTASAIGYLELTAAPEHSIDTVHRAGVESSP